MTTTDAAEQVLCATCSRPATRFVEADADHDPHCEACFKEAFEECPKCHKMVWKENIVQVQTYAATRLDPAEYDEMCLDCAPREEDPDDAYDYWGEREDD